MYSSAHTYIGFAVIVKCLLSYLTDMLSLMWLILRRKKHLSLAYQESLLEFSCKDILVYSFVNQPGDNVFLLLLVLNLHASSTIFLHIAFTWFQWIKSLRGRVNFIGVANLKLSLDRIGIKGDNLRYGNSHSRDCRMDRVMQRLILVRSSFKTKPATRNYNTDSIQLLPRTIIVWWKWGLTQREVGSTFDIKKNGKNDQLISNAWQ